LLPEERRRTVEIQIYTASSWSHKTETRIEPTINREKNTGKHEEK